MNSLPTFQKKLFSKQQGKQLGESVVYRQIFVDGGTWLFSDLLSNQKTYASTNKYSEHCHASMTQWKHVMLLSNLVSRIENYVIVWDKRCLPHSFSAAVTASSINGLLKQVGTESGGCTRITRDPGTPRERRVCTMEKASRVFPYTRALPEIKSLVIHCLPWCYKFFSLGYYG